jgi:ATP-dependent RNA helicase DeaD
VVLDEADEMLDMGFAEDLEAILNAAPPERQTILFSATMPNRIDSIASFLAQTAMQRFSAVATAVEYLSELVDLVAGAAEHDGSVWGFDVEYPAERCRLVTPVDDVGNLTNERRAVAG